ncbi:DUF4202 domain-containing protein [Paenirhodobacter enshiensis]|uniref:DUF4202 domain-containing protein n=1 Tax=Paenirhodobacter enshiensis TaxID=1105367 RepID=UPI0035B4DEFA
MMTRLYTATAAIDAANAADPSGEALLYGQRMSAELDRLFPDASEALRLAARGQHIERWLLPRSDYPEGRTGYLDWRREQGRRHGERVAGIMRAAGYDEAEAARAAQMLRKEGLKRDAEVQALEDVICFVFLRHYFAPFAPTRPAEELTGIVAKTARKMSAEGRARALAEFDLPEPFAALFR